MPGTYSAIEVPFPHPKSQVNQYESSQLVPNFVKKSDITYSQTAAEYGSSWSLWGNQLDRCVVLCRRRVGDSVEGRHEVL